MTKTFRQMLSKIQPHNADLINDHEDRILFFVWFACDVACLLSVKNAWQALKLLGLGKKSVLAVIQSLLISNVCEHFDLKECLNAHVRATTPQVLLWSMHDFRLRKKILSSDLCFYRPWKLFFGASPHLGFVKAAFTVNSFHYFKTGSHKELLRLNYLCRLLQLQ